MSDDAPSPGPVMADTPPSLPLVQRLWLILTQAALLLPFVTARDCANSELEDYTGLEMYTHDGGQAAFVPLLVATVVLFVFPYRGAPIGRALAPVAVRAFAATVALLLALAAPGFALLFDELTYRIGWYVHVGGWSVFTAAFIGGALLVLARGGGARPRGRLAATVIALLGAPPVAVMVKRLHEDLSPLEALVGFLVGLVLMIPLALAGLGFARQDAEAMPATPDGARLRALWRVLVALMLGVHAVAAVSD